MLLAVASALVAAVLPLAGKTVAIDPGHAGGNATHAAQIARLVDAGTLRKPCDTVGASTNDGFAEHAYNLDVSLRLPRGLRPRRPPAGPTPTHDTRGGPGHPE